MDLNVRQVSLTIITNQSKIIWLQGLNNNVPFLFRFTELQLVMMT